MQIDENDKDEKKRYKKVIQLLEKEGKITLSSDGIVSISKSELSKKKKSKKDKKDKSKKRKLEEEEEDDDDDDKVNKKRKKKKEKKKNKDMAHQETSEEYDENDHVNEEDNNKDDDDNDDDDETDKNKPCRGNPQGVTRLFVGNLPFSVNEISLSEFLLPGKVTHIKWITDKETGRFYGSAFIEMNHSKGAASALSKDGQMLTNRPIKINYAPAREGDVWPPPTKIVTGGSSSKNSKGAAAGGVGVKAMGEKPANCMKLFIGNLSYDIDDEGIFKFFAAVDAEVKAVRWLHHKDTGDFKGVGFVEFWNEEACARGATLNGKNLLGRPIRIDWTD